MLLGVELCKQVEVYFDLLTDVGNGKEGVNEFIKVFQQSLEHNVLTVLVGNEGRHEDAVGQLVRKTLQFGVQHNDVLLQPTPVSSQNLNIFYIEILIFGGSLVVQAKTVVKVEAHSHLYDINEAV